MLVYSYLHRCWSRGRMPRASETPSVFYCLLIWSLIALHRSWKWREFTFSWHLALNFYSRSGGVDWRPVHLFITSLGVTSRDACKQKAWTTTLLLQQCFFLWLQYLLATVAFNLSGHVRCLWNRWLRYTPKNVWITKFDVVAMTGGWHLRK